MLKNNTIFYTWILLIVAAITSGCATNKNSVDPKDPYERYNRQMFQFNQTIDHGIVRPIAKGYVFITPKFAQKGVQNFFGNVSDVSSAVNKFLQFKIRLGITGITRVVINSTLGIGGLFDVATPMGVIKDHEDFGLTLKYWGSENTPYLVLPILGPSTVRDTIGLPIDYFLLSPWTYIQPVPLQIGVVAFDLIQRRAALLPGDKVFDEAFDPYVFMRDAYLQRRVYLSGVDKDKTADTFVINDNY